MGRMDERDTTVWAAVYAAVIIDCNHRTATNAADVAVTEYRNKSAGPPNLYYAGKHFTNESDLIDYLKHELYQSYSMMEFLRNTRRS